MIRVAHFTYLLNVSGASNSLLMHCKHHDRRKFEYAVVALDGGERVEAIRNEGVPVYTGYESLYAVAQWADIINMNLGNFDGPLLVALQQLGKPFVFTLRWASPLPPIPALVICTAEHTYNIQPDKSRTVFIRNGIDLEKFNPQPKENNDNGEVIITRVCRPARCSLYFWTAIQKVLKKYPQAKLWIVGNVDGLGKDTEQIKFLGVRRDVPEILAQSDIFAYTPYPNEGSMDLAVMEALAMGVPCVSADTNAVRESIVDGENGFLVPFGDEEAFAMQLGRLVEDAKLRSQMRENALHKSRPQFDMRWTIAQYEAVYKGVLEGHGYELSFAPETNPELAALSTKARDIVTSIIAEKEVFEQEVSQAAKQILAEHGPNNGMAIPFAAGTILPPMEEVVAADTAAALDLEALQLLQRLTGESASALNAQLARLNTSACMKQALQREILNYSQQLGIGKP